METKIFVIGVPTFGNVVEKISEALKEAFEKPEPRCSKPAWTPRPAPKPQWTPRPNPCGCGATAPEWGIAGEPACENKRFGAAFEIDEPRCEDYDIRWQFESDHAAYDKFVEAGEDCIARGMGKKGNAPITKCQAVRQPLNCPPPMNRDFIGETHWWDCEDFGW